MPCSLRNYRKCWRKTKPLHFSCYITRTHVNCQWSSAILKETNIEVEKLVEGQRQKLMCLSFTLTYGVICFIIHSIISTECSVNCNYTPFVVFYFSFSEVVLFVSISVYVVHSILYKWSHIITIINKCHFNIQMYTSTELNDWSTCICWFHLPLLIYFASLYHYMNFKMLVSNVRAHTIQLLIPAPPFIPTESLMWI